MKYLAITLISLLFGINANANQDTYSLGCVDCWKFSAPSVLDSTDISPPEEGQIVYEATTNRFKGYSTQDGWHSFSNRKSVKTVTDDYTVLVSDEVILASTSTEDITISLPSAASMEGKLLTIKKTDSNSYNVIIDGYLAESIDGKSVEYLNSKNDYFTVVSDGSNWQVTGWSLNGYVENILTGNSNATSSANTWETAYSSQSITISPGVWEVGYCVALTINRSSGGSNSAYGGNVALYNDTSSSVETDSISFVWRYLSSATGDYLTVPACHRIRKDVTSNTTFKLYLRNSSSSTHARTRLVCNDLTGGLTNPDAKCSFYAKRVR